MNPITFITEPNVKLSRIWTSPGAHSPSHRTGPPDPVTTPWRLRFTSALVSLACAASLLTAAPDGAPVTLTAHGPIPGGEPLVAGEATGWLEPTAPFAAGWTRLTLPVGVSADARDTHGGVMEGSLLRSSGIWNKARRRTFNFTGLSDLLIDRMNREARRYGRNNRLSPVERAGGEDSIDEEQRARQAEKIITRSFNRTFDQQLEDVARSIHGLGKAIAWVEGLGRPWESRQDASAADPASAVSETDAIRLPRRFKSHIGLRVGAHPKVLIRAEFWSVRARLELPVLDDPIRLSLERPLGRRGRATLDAGLSRDGDDWLSVGFRLGF